MPRCLTSICPKEALPCQCPFANDLIEFCYGNASIGYWPLFGEEFCAILDTKRPFAKRRARLGVALCELIQLLNAASMSEIIIRLR